MSIKIIQGVGRHDIFSTILSAPLID